MHYSPRPQVPRFIFTVSHHRLGVASKVKDVEKEVCSTISRHPGARAFIGQRPHFWSLVFCWVILVVNMGNVLEILNSSLT